MSDSLAAPATTADAVDEPMPRPPSAAPWFEVSSTEVLITEQEVVAAPQPLWECTARTSAAGSSPSCGDRSRPQRMHHGRGHGITQRVTNSSSTPSWHAKCTDYERSHRRRLRRAAGDAHDGDLQPAVMA